MNSTGHHRWRRDWLRKWLRTCDVCGRGKLQQRMVGVQCLYVSRLKEQAGKWHWPFAMWANCCRARRRRLQDDGGFPVNCGPVHMHAYGTADAMHKRCMNCWYFPVAMGSVLDLYACLRSFVGEPHATVVTACRSQDFGAACRKTIWDNECRGQGSHDNGDPCPCPPTAAWEAAALSSLSGTGNLRGGIVTGWTSWQVHFHLEKEKQRKNHGISSLTLLHMPGKQVSK